jgi:hypothetical protein
LHLVALVVLQVLGYLAAIPYLVPLHQTAEVAEQQLLLLDQMEGLVAEELGMLPLVLAIHQ